MDNIPNSPETQGNPIDAGGMLVDQLWNNPGLSQLSEERRRSYLRPEVTAQLNGLFDELSPHVAQLQDQLEANPNALSDQNNKAIADQALLGIGYFRKAAQRDLLSVLDTNDHLFDQATQTPYANTTEAFYKILNANTNAGTFNQRNAAYWLPIIQGLTSGGIYVELSNNPDTPTQFEQDIKSFARGVTDIGSINFLKDIITQSFHGRGRSPEDVERRVQALLTRPTTPRTPRTNEYDSSRDLKFQFLKLFEKDSQEDKYAKQIYELLQSGNTDDIRRWYLELVRENGNDKKRATEVVYETFQYIIHAIFETTLSKAPDKEFMETAREQGTYMADPQRIFNELILNKLGVLMNVAQSSGRTEGSDNAFAGFEERVQRRINEAGEIEETIVPSRQYKDMDFADWVRGLNKIVTIERNAIEFQFNMVYALRKATQVPDAPPIMTLLANLSKKLDPDTFNYLMLLPGNEWISQGTMALNQSWKTEFMLHDWMRKESYLGAKAGEAFVAEDEALKSMMRDTTAKAWQLRRGRDLAKIGAYGREFIPLLLSSMARPDWTGDGPSFRTEGVIPAPFRVLADAMRWWIYSSEGNAFGAPYMMARHQVDHWDPLTIRKKGQENYQRSFTMGLLPYMDDEDFQGTVPWILKWNIFNQGGVDAGGGWRMKNQYAALLNDPENPIISLNELRLRLGKGEDNHNDYGKEIFVHGWKTLENVGVDVLRNFCLEYVLNDASFERDKEGNFKYLDRFELLFKHIYSRCFSDQNRINQGGFYGEFRTPEAYWDYVKGTVFIEDQTIPIGSRSRELQKHVYNALSIMLFERNPTEIYKLEEPSNSQNGVTMFNEINRELKREESKDMWGDTDEIIADRHKKAIQDLDYVQQKVRLTATAQMQRRLDQEQGRNRTGIFYGDLSSDRSVIQYEVNESQIRAILGANRASQDEIDRTVALYNMISRRIWQKPEARRIDPGVNGSGDEVVKHFGNEKYEELEEKYIVERMRWFGQSWQNGMLGVQFTDSTADCFFDRSAPGGGLIERTAMGVELLTSTFKNLMTGNDKQGLTGIYDLIKNAVQNGGPEAKEKIAESLKNLYSIMKNEDSGVAKLGVSIALEMVIQGLKASDYGRTVWGLIDSNLISTQFTLGGDKVGPTATEHYFTEQDIHDLVMMFADTETLNSATKEQYKLVPVSDEEALQAKREGREPQMHWVRDMESEVSAKTILEAHKATVEQVLKKYGPLGGGVLFLAILWSIIKGAFDEYQSG